MNKRALPQVPDVLPGHWESSEGLTMARDYASRRRADLAMSDRTDMGLANALYLAEGALPIQTAAKERMRWLSVQLALANRVRATLLDVLAAAAEFIEEEADNRAAAGSAHSDYEREPRDLAERLRAALAEAEGLA